MLQPRKYQHGGRITNISLLLSLLLVNFILGSAEELIQDPDDDRGSSIDDELIRVKRNHGDWESSSLVIESTLTVHNKNLLHDIHVSNDVNRRRRGSIKHEDNSQQHTNRRNQQKHQTNSNTTDHVNKQSRVADRSL